MVSPVESRALARLAQTLEGEDARLFDDLLRRDASLIEYPTAWQQYVEDRLEKASALWKFDPSQPRDREGRFASNGAGSAYPTQNANTPQNQVEALNTYRTNGYKYINAVARGVDPNSVEGFGEYGRSTKEIESDILALDEIIASTPALAEPTLLYRSIGEGNTAERIRGIPNGGTFTDSGFTSTSSNESYGLGFAGGEGIKIVIEAPAGMKVLDINKYVGDTSSVTENEVLLPRKTTFKIERREYSTIFVKAVSNG